MERPARLALGICALALSLRVAAFFVLGRASHPDLWESEVIATNLLEGRGFTYPFLGTTYRSYMEPLYPGLCAAVYALTGHSFVALGMLQALLGAALVGLVFLCGRRIAGDEAGLSGAGLAAVHPGLIVYATKFHPFILDSLLLLGVVAGCLFFTRARPVRSAVALGAVLGLCVLTRATVLVCLPVIIWWVAARTERRPLALALLLGTAALVVAPWVARNHVVHDRFVLTRTGTSLVFWLGNNRHAFSGSSATREGTPLYDAIPEAQRQRLRQLDELGQQQLFAAEASSFVRERPLAFLQRWAVKLGYFWWQTPQGGQLYPAAGYRAYQAFYLAMLALVIAGAIAHRRRSETWLVVGFVASIAVAQSAYYIEGRHRLAVEPILLLLAGAGLERARRSLSNR